MSDSRDLVLYYRPTCPFCVRVTNFIDRNGIQVKLRNISKDPQAAATLIEVGGKQQVPCLFIDGKPLYDSSDIIDWLQENA